MVTYSIICLNLENNRLLSMKEYFWQFWLEKHQEPLRVNQQ